MMTKEKPPAQINPPEPHDPFKMRSIEQILSLFDSGQFLAEIMKGHKNLMHELLEHNAEFGPKGCEGSMTITVKYAAGNAGDVGMGGTVNFKLPKKPPSSAGAYIDEDGELTLYSPMMKQMQRPVRDVNFNPETGEIRDID
jgi:hypothetical protein